MVQTPSGGAGHGAAVTDTGLLSIGAVLNVLREEFPEVTISKIRFLESEGLVEPRRTPSGYRKFSAEDVDRLGHVLRMQRDHYLPLKVIREHLAAMERGDFYASTGVTLSDYQVTARSMTITVAKTAFSKYRVQFIGRGGRVLREVAEPVATYDFVGDEGYVRARVLESNGDMAWTQPVMLR